MSNDGVNHDRRRFLIGGACVTGAVGGVFAAVPFVGSWAPSAKAKAAGAPVKANISKLEPGQMMTVEWRGKPVYVVRRTEAVLESLQKTKDDVSDPNSAASKQPAYVDPFHRAINPEYLILVGLCTHLGCAPQFQPQVGPTPFNANWQGGFFCPCHGSQFDLAGRVYKGVPAPTNLEVPPHRFDGDILVVGEDQEAA